MPTLDEIEAEPASPPIALPIWTNLRRPHCYNRPPFPEAELVPLQGYHETLALLIHQRARGAERKLPRYRIVWRKMSTDCKAWATPSPTETPAPVIDRYDCRGCRWMPERARIHFHGE